jgi:hypothetical protein
VPAWITEDTTATLGRESKFLRFNLLPCAPNGPWDDERPAVPRMVMQAVQALAGGDDDGGGAAPALA